MGDAKAALWFHLQYQQHPQRVPVQYLLQHHKEDYPKHHGSWPVTRTAFNDDPVWEIYNQKAKKRYLDLLTKDKERIEARLRLKEEELQAQIDAVKNAQGTQEDLAKKTDTLAESNEPGDREKEGELLGKESNAVKTESKKLDKVHQAQLEVNKVNAQYQKVKKQYDTAVRAYDYAQKLVANAKAATGDAQCVDPDTLERIRDNKACKKVQETSGPRKDCRWNQLGDYSCTIEKPPAPGLSLQEFRVIEKARTSRKSAVKLTRERMLQQERFDTEHKGTARDLAHTLHREAELWGKAYRRFMEDVLAVQNKWLGKFAAKQAAADTTLARLNKEKTEHVNRLSSTLADSLTEFRRMQAGIERAETTALQAHPEFRNPRDTDKEKYFQVMMTPQEKKAMQQIEESYKEALRQLKRAKGGVVKNLRVLLHDIEEKWDNAMLVEENKHPELRAAARKRRFKPLCAIVDPDTCPAGADHRAELVSQEVRWRLVERLRHLLSEYALQPTEAMWLPVVREYRFVRQWARLNLLPNWMGGSTVPLARRLFHDHGLWESQNEDLVKAYYRYEKFFAEELEPAMEAKTNAMILQRRVKRRITKTERQIEEGRWVAAQADRMEKKLLSTGLGRGAPAVAQAGVSFCGVLLVQLGVTVAESVACMFRDPDHDKSKTKTTLPKHNSNKRFLPPHELRIRCHRIESTSAGAFVHLCFL
ncbi:unnamed protein product [Amoebophrya sp. A120]|nr:unnamed protein product [Amoebophrya sp. A120]|eukprot:GSA120T00018008001.1